MKDNAESAAITTSVPLRPTTANPINTKRLGAHTVTGAQQPPVNHTANLPDPSASRSAGLPSPPGRACHTSCRALG